MLASGSGSSRPHKRRSPQPFDCGLSYQWSALQELQSIFERMETDYEETPPGHEYEVQRPLKRETQLAIWICLGTLYRIGELLMTRWEDVDLVER